MVNKKNRYLVVSFSYAKGNLLLIIGRRFNRAAVFFVCLNLDLNDSDYGGEKEVAVMNTAIFQYITVLGKAVLKSIFRK